jgi:hypothetical protein
MLALGTLLTLLDSVAAGVAIFDNAVGIVGNEAGTVALGAASNRDLLAAIDDASVQTDLTPAFANRASLVRASSLAATLQGGMLQRALDRHYGAVGNGNLNAFLKNNDARVSDSLRLIGMQIDARNVFPPFAVDPVARYDGTGAGTGTFVAGAEIDRTQFGEAAFEIVVEAMGAAARTVRLSLKNFDDTIETRDVVVPANTVANTAIGVGGAGDRYVGVTGISTVGGGGTAADRLRVRSRIERVPAL